MSFESRFSDCADEFQRYRPEYPPGLYARIFETVATNPATCAIDLGAGTGIVAGHLASRFQTVIAVEPDAGMAAKLAQQFPQVSIRQCTAEELAHPADTVDLVTIANALHWMDARCVFAKVREWLRINAVLAAFDRPLPRASAAVDAVVMAEFRGPWKPHRDLRLRRDLTWKDETRAAAGFRLVEETRFPNLLSLSPADYAGFWRSTSYGSAYARTLSDSNQYWGDLQQRLAVASADEAIVVDFSSTLILLRKN